jgi:hypothetical protein
MRGTSQVDAKVHQQLLPLLRGLVAAPCPPSSACYKKAIAAAARSLSEALIESKTQQQERGMGMGADRGQVAGGQLQQEGDYERLGGVQSPESSGRATGVVLQEAVVALAAALK